MGKAQERAREAYPFYGKSATTYLGTITFDQHADERVAYIKGYEQAEKDLGWDEPISYEDFVKAIAKNIPHRPFEWSEHDEEMLSNTLDSLKKYQLSMPSFRVELEMRWLRTLSERIK